MAESSQSTYESGVPDTCLKHDCYTKRQYEISVEKEHECGTTEFVAPNESYLVRQSHHVFVKDHR